MPRIQSKTVAAQRDWRRSQLIDAAASIALESGGAAITVAAVANRAGLSRTTVYEYFASSSDLVADLVIDELKNFSSTLEIAIADILEPELALAAWMRASLIYIADGRHLLAKALNSISLPQSRATAIGAAHRALLSPLTENLRALGIADIAQALSFIQGVSDAASKRIESGSDADHEIEKTTAFCLAGIRGLI